MADKAKKILVVDDDADIVTYITTLLQDNGYQTVAASDGTQALEQVRKERPALICLDITMPETTGVKFYREMKESEEYRSIPIVMVTGVTEEFKQFISSRRQVPPPDGYISKPINEAELLATIQRLV